MNIRIYWGIGDRDILIIIEKRARLTTDNDIYLLQVNNENIIVNDNYINIERLENYFCIIYEDKIYYIHGTEKKEILSEKDYMFFDAKLIKNNDAITIVATTTAKYDCKKCKIIIYEESL